MDQEVNKILDELGDGADSSPSGLDLAHDAYVVIVTEAKLDLVDSKQKPGKRNAFLDVAFKVTEPGVFEGRQKNARTYAFCVEDALQFSVKMKAAKETNRDPQLTDADIKAQQSLGMFKGTLATWFGLRGPKPGTFLPGFEWLGDETGGFCGEAVRSLFKAVTGKEVYLKVAPQKNNEDFTDYSLISRRAYCKAKGLDPDAGASAQSSIPDPTAQV